MEENFSFLLHRFATPREGRVVVCFYTEGREEGGEGEGEVTCRGNLGLVIRMLPDDHPYSCM
jgi:hypothetical protein